MVGGSKNIFNKNDIKNVEDMIKSVICFFQFF